MKTLVPLLFFAGAAFGTTIPVTGTGSFSLDNFKDTYASACFSGSDGTASVSGCVTAVPIGPAAPTWLDGDSLYNPQMLLASPIIDGASSPEYSIRLGPTGTSYIALMDKTGNVIRTQDISGVIEITSYQEIGSRFLASGVMNDDWSASGTFRIAAVSNAASVDPAGVPEPGTGYMMGAGALWGMWRRILMNHRRA